MSIPGKWTDVNKTTFGLSERFALPSGVKESSSMQPQKVVIYRRTGSSTPRFSTLAPWELPMRSATADASTEMLWWGNVTNRVSRSYTGGSAYLSGLWTFPVTTPRSVSTETENSMLRILDARLLGKIKNQKVNVGIAFAERKRTADMLLKTSRRFVSAYRALRHGNFADAASFFGVQPRKRAMRRFNRQYLSDRTNAVTSGWLELTYGWRPLMNDLYGSVQQVAEIYQGNRKMTARAVQRRELYYKESNRYGTLRSTLFGHYNLTLRKSIRFSIDPYANRLLSELGITNPLLVAWEVVPYSFVFDWFLPIGKYLENIDALYGLKFDTGSYTRFAEYSLTAGAEMDLWYGQLRYSITGIQFSRTVLTDFPNNRFPQFKSPLSVSHSLSAFSLLWQSKPWKR